MENTITLKYADEIAPLLARLQAIPTEQHDSLFIWTTASKVEKCLTIANVNYHRATRPQIKRLSASALGDLTNDICVVLSSACTYVLLQQASDATATQIAYLFEALGLARALQEYATCK